MTDQEIANTIIDYQIDYNLPTTDVLKHGCDKLVKALLNTFPKLKRELVLL